MQNDRQCQYQYDEGKCQNEAMWGADYCIMHIDERYAVPDTPTTPLPD